MSSNNNHNNNETSPTASIMTLTTSTTTITIHLKVIGMMCQRNCGTTVENALKMIAIENSTTIINVLDAKALYSESRAYVTFKLVQQQSVNNHDDDIQSLLMNESIDAIECVGFDAEVIPNIDDYIEEIRIQQQREPQQIPPEQKIVDAPMNHDLTTTKTNTIVLRVHGMSCAVCTGRVERTLRTITGVAKASVVLATHQAIVELCDYNDDTYNDNIDVDSNEYYREISMNCVTAVNHSGYECELQQTFWVDSNTNTNTTYTLRQSAEQLEQSRIHELNTWKYLLFISISLTIPLVYICNIHQTNASTTTPTNGTSDESMNDNMDMDNTRMTNTSMMIQMWIMCILSSIVQFVVGKRFYISAYHGLRNGFVMGMDFLICLGTTSSYIYSIIILLIIQFHVITSSTSIHLQPTFMTGPMLLSFVTFGKFLESYAKGKTVSALQHLMELQPLSAQKVILGTNTGVLNETTDLATLQTMEVNIGDIHIGDYLVVLPGGRIPTDAKIIAISSSTSTVNSNNNNNKLNTSSTTKQKQTQQAFVDESALSGEPFPVAKCIQDTVIGSTINQLSVLLIQVTAVGDSTTLSKIVHLMEHAQRNKAPIQAYADYIASIFAPIVISLSIITFIGWITLNNGSGSTSNFSQQDRFFYAFTSAISVIVIACPCALGLATPTAVMVGTGVGATHGLLIKGGTVLENMHQTNTIIFDKTGTLTTGKAILSEYKNEYDLLVVSSSSCNNGNDTDDTKTKNRYSNPFEYDSLYTNLPKRNLKSPASVSSGTNCDDDHPIVSNENVALWLAACAEVQSEHPLAKAIVNGARTKMKNIGTDITLSSLVRVSDFNIVPGMGVECTISVASSTTTTPMSSNDTEWGPWQVRVGTKSWTKENVNNFDIDEDVCAENSLYNSNVTEDTVGDECATNLRKLGHIVVYVSVLKIDCTTNIAKMNQLCTSNHEKQQEQRRRVIGVLGIIDPIQKEAKSTIAALKLMNVDVWMCTGDHEITASAVATQVCIDATNVCASATPEAKADLVSRLQKRRIRTEQLDDYSERRVGRTHLLSSVVEGDNLDESIRSNGEVDVKKPNYIISRWDSKSYRKGRVAVVGDGINDAIALARADVGIAIGAGTEIAVEAADVVLVKSSLHDVVVAFHLSKVVFRRIMMNFVWAMGYNLIALPFAAGVLYPITSYRLPPAMAGLMMAFSSVSVVTSSLLLRMYERPLIHEDGTMERGSGLLSAIEHTFESISSTSVPGFRWRRFGYQDITTQIPTSSNNHAGSIEIV